MEDHIDVDAMYEERTHLADEAAVGFDEWTRCSEEEAWQEEEEMKRMQWEE